MRHDVTADCTERGPTRAPELPVDRERITPWLVGAAVAALLNLAVVLNAGASVAVQALLLLGLAACLAAAGLITARSNRELESRDREQRARPAVDELDERGAQPGSASYVEGMTAWTRAVRELIEHAGSEVDPADPVAQELATAAEDTSALCDLLEASAGGSLGLNEKAVLHSVCTLWEANQPHLERLAAAVDPHWHRRWRARSVVAAQLRHGPPDRRDVLLPYRS